MNTETKLAFAFLSDRKPIAIGQSDYVFLLMEFMEAKGEEAIQALAGAYLFAVTQYKGDPQKCQRFLRNVFGHDLGGRHDKLLEPKSSGYLTVWKEEQNSIVI